MVAPGQSATFSVAARGASPLRYQWRRDGALLTGEVAGSFTRTAASATDDGARFSCTVENDVGSMTSRETRLTVAEPSTDAGSASGSDAGRGKDPALPGDATTGAADGSLVADDAGSGGGTDAQSVDAGGAAPRGCGCASAPAAVHAALGSASSRGRSVAVAVV